MSRLSEREFLEPKGPILPFSIATYNVLATAYMHPAHYRRSPKMILNPTWRVPALAQYVANLTADVICLQEVEPDALATLRTRLGSLGYAAHYARRRGGKPDGCATFYRQEIFKSLEARAVAYRDGDKMDDDSGDIALIVVLRGSEGILGVANTHLMWEPPGTPDQAQRAHRKARQLLSECASATHGCRGWIICGDLNATPDSPAIAAIEAAGFHHTRRGLSEAFTCNVGGQAKMIDYLFHSSELHSIPRPILPISAQAPLPSAEQPSDHLPVIADLNWEA